MKGGFVPTSWLREFTTDADTAALNSSYRRRGIQKRWYRAVEDHTKIRLYSSDYADAP